MAATDPITPEPRHFSIRPRKETLVVALLAGGFVLLVIVTAGVGRSLNGPPFQMIVEPDDDHATVQFAQAGTGLISKSFRIDRHFDRRQVVVLDSPTVPIPGGRIEFSDTTLMPGRFTIRLGETVFDVMPRGIDVDGQHFGWLHGDPLP